MNLRHHIVIIIIIITIIIPLTWLRDAVKP